MKNAIPIYGVSLIPEIQFKYNSKIYLTLSPKGDILITDTEKKLQLLTHVPEESTLIDIIQTIEDCLPLKPETSQTTET